jgi:hypothetical protein
VSATTTQQAKGQEVAPEAASLLSARDELPTADDERIELADDLQHKALEQHNQLVTQLQTEIDNRIISLRYLGKSCNREPRPGQNYGIHPNSFPLARPCLSFRE